MLGATATLLWRHYIGELVAAATVVMSLSGPGRAAVFSGDTGTGKKNQGICRTGWVPDLSDGTYSAEVASLRHDTYTWNRSLDPTANDTDSDTDNLPDQQHNNPH